MDNRPLGRLATGVIFASGVGMVAAVIAVCSWLLDALVLPIGAS